GDGARSAMGLDRQQPLAQAVAPGTAACRLGNPLPRLDGASGTDAPRQSPGFVIESAGIDHAAGTLEPGRQAPTFAAADFRPAIPGQAYPGRQAGMSGMDVLQFEPHHIAAPVRQPGHLPFQPEGSPVEVYRQTVIERPLSVEAG